jgi:hypothetical protein
MTNISAAIKAHFFNIAFLLDLQSMSSHTLHKATVRFLPERPRCKQNARRHARAERNS